MATTHIVRVFRDGSAARVDSIDTEQGAVTTLVDYLMRENDSVRGVLATPYGQVTEAQKDALLIYENAIRTRTKAHPTAAVHCDEDGTLTIATKE